jgi:hypothetical protein
MDTFFQNSSLPTKKIFQLSYWAYQLGNIEHLEFETGIGHTSIVQWTQFSLIFVQSVFWQILNESVVMALLLKSMKLVSQSESKTGFHSF